MRWYEEDPKGHQWETYEDVGGVVGDTNIYPFSYEEGHHNGPRCINCGYGFCHHCVKSTDELPPCRKS